MIIRFIKKQSFQPDLRGIFVNPFFYIRYDLFNSISEFASSLSGKLIDFGCGRKPYRNLINVSEYIGVDIEQSGHDHSNSEIDVFYNGKEIPFPENTFDSLFCAEVIEHIFDPEIILPELNRVLKKGGKALFTVPFIMNEHEMPYDYGRYTIAGLTHLLNRHGFTILESRKSGHYTKALVQLFSLYIYELFKKLGKTGHVLSLILIVPWHILSFPFILLFPKNKSLYFNTVILCEKK